MFKAVDAVLRTHPEVGEYNADDLTSPMAAALIGDRPLTAHVQSTFILAALLTSDHLRVSAAMKVPKFFRGSRARHAPSLTKLACISAVSRPALMVAFSSLTMLAGVARRRDHAIERRHHVVGDAALDHGSAGRNKLRARLAGDRQRAQLSLPDQRQENRHASNVMCTCAPNTAVTDSPPLLYGTPTMSTPALDLNSSPVR